jgi:hypothetical protein
MTQKIEILTSELISCAQPLSTASLEDPMSLGPMDFSTPIVVPIDIAFLYRNNETSPHGEFMPFNRFKRAMSRVLDYYPHLTGRLQLRQADKAIEISRMGAGALLVSASCNSELNSFLPTSTTRLTQLHLPDGGNTLIPEQEATNEELLENPLFRTQHTRFTCGSVAVGFRICHTLCDAEGLFQLVSDLAEIYRQIRAHDLSGSDASFEANLPAKPIIKSYLKDFFQASPECRLEALRKKPWNLSRADDPSEPNGTTDVVQKEQGSHGQREAKNGSKPLQTSSDLPLDTVPRNSGRIARITRTELDFLKEKASNVGLGLKFTAFESLAAHIHQQVLRARVRQLESTNGSLESISTRFLFSVNQRRADRLNLPSRYFPNAPICTFASPPFETIEGPLSYMAAAFHDALLQITPESAETSLRWISSLPDKTQLRMPYMDSKLFTFTQWSGFNVYKGMEFDSTSAGVKIPPTLFYRPFSALMLGLDGLCHIMPTEDQLNSPIPTSSLDLTLILSDPVWNFLASDDPIMSKFLQQN